MIEIIIKHTQGDSDISRIIFWAKDTDNFSDSECLWEGKQGDWILEDNTVWD